MDEKVDAFVRLFREEYGEDVLKKVISGEIRAEIYIGMLSDRNKICRQKSKKDLTHSDKNDRI